MVVNLSEDSPQWSHRPSFPIIYDTTQDVEKLRHVALTGDVHAKIPNVSHIIRLFISSTFKDMSDERDKIMHVIYPKLEKYCSSKGYILQIVDMRWGIFESASNEQLTTDICLDEIRLAKELSNGPFFIAILSHRYGSKFSPRSITKIEFDLLLQQCNQNEKNLLHTWYDIDKNNIPIIYNLKSLEDDDLKNKWETSDSKLVIDLLRRCANAANLNEDDQIKYTRSVTEIEIQEGIFKTDDYHFRCLAFFRHIHVFDQIKPGIIDPTLMNIFNKYVDMNLNTNEIEYECQQMIKNLKERIQRKLPKRNVKQFIVDINSISELMQNTLINENFENYLIEFTDLFERNIVNLIEANINKNEILFHVFENYADLFHHLRFCHEKVKGFMGRHSFINQIHSLLLEQHAQYIVIYGISGSGKTSLIAKIAEKLKDWFHNINFITVLRFIGTSEDSYNIQNLLSSIIKQLAHCFDLIINYEEMTPIDKLYNYFKKFLIEISQECVDDQQVFILLDSLDQLSPEYSSRKLDWFPIGLPKNIRFIISTLNDRQYEAFQAIQNLVKNTSNNYIEITELNEDEIRSTIQYRLDHAQRTLTDIQMEYLVGLFKKCRIPLYIKLVMDQAIKWKHSISMKNMSVSDEIKPAIHDLLGKVELSYGIVLVEKVLQYMTLSRHGFYENYLQNILTNDPTVLRYIEDEFKNHKFSSSRIPQIFLIRLIHALREYLSGPMYRWYHRAFWEVATDRYCQNDQSNQDCHKTIVKTYQHEKFNKSNPFWMNELPYHATCANNIDELKNNFLLNLKFMQIKAQGSDIDQLITDYEFAIHKHNDDQTLRLVHQVLLIAAYKIRQDPLQLPGQLYGRLYGYETSSDLKNLLEQCLSPLEDAIVSSGRFMAGPNNLLSKSLIAHKTEIKSTLISNDNQKVISCSIDNCIKVFDGKTLKETLTIYKNYDSTTILTISNDDTILYVWCRITEEKHKGQPLIEAFSLTTGDHLFNVRATILHDDSTKHREILFSNLKNDLWLVTKHNWYHLDWQTGTVQSILKIPQEFAQRSDKIICIDKAQDRIVMGLDMEPIVLSLNENGNYTLRDLLDQTVMGRRFLILTNLTLAISTRRIFKSLYDDKDMEWNILLCHLESLEIQRRIPVNKALRMWRSSLDSTKIFCNAFNYIYVLDIEKRQTDFILEHSSQMNSCSLLNELTVISATWDNKLHVWNLSEASSQNSNNVNLFDPFSSRMIQFLYDEFNTLSRYVFVYNVFNEHSKELFILYDLSTQKIVRRCQIDKYVRNDLQPICFISQQFVLLFCLSEKNYYFLNIDQFTIVKEFSSDESRVFKKIYSNQVVMSIRNDRDHTNSLVLLDCNLLCFETIIPMWNHIEWHTVNSQTIIYKNKSNPTVFMFKIVERHLSVLSLDIGDDPIDQMKSSSNGKYLAAIYMIDAMTKSIKVYRIENTEQVSLCFEKTNLKQLGEMKFVGDQYFVYQHKEGSNRLTYCYDLCTNTLYLWFQDDDSQGLFDCLKHERSKYIWYQRYQVSRMNKVKTDISVFHIQDISKPICSLDVDCRLKINQVALFDNGNAMLVKVLDKLEFVAFFLKSKTKNTEENTIHFDLFRLNDLTTQLTLTKGIFYQFCRKFSFTHYAMEFK
ncbi:unnamed protein product [Rotaria sordida]|uniref:NACHT domain-containing protein n=1 Tax=Rotaria sordida TaxID=392033 RepID=A0A814ZB14_9BILA|nr:unnamed protein product [Rotaria sordida]